MVPLGCITAVLEFGGAGAVFLLVRLITDASALDSIQWLKPLRSVVPAMSRSRAIPLVALMVAAVFVLKGLVRVGEVYLRERTTRRNESDIAVAMLARYLNAPYAFHLKRNSPELIHNVESGALGVCAEALGAATTVATELLVALSVIAMVVWVTPRAAVVAFGIGLLAFGSLALTQKQTLRLAKKRLDAIIVRHGTVRDSLEAISDLKLLGRTDFFLERYRAAHDTFARAEAHWVTLQWVPRLMVETIFVCGLAATILAMDLGESEIWLMAPTLGIFAYAALRLLPSFHLVVFHLNRVTVATPVVDALYRDFVALPRPSASTATARTPLPFDRQIEIEHVSYTYEGNTRPTLHDLHAVIHHGESIGIVGSTGAGKSTLIAVLLGLLEPTTGRVTVDGHDIRDSVDAWQRQLGVVPQQVLLLDGSIAANIALGIDPEHIDLGRVREVAEMAQLRTWIDSLPDGFETHVGERGVRVSGGERQRIAIARALYRDPAVVVLDEATSALDNATEKAIAETIERLHGRKTTIIIAHRLSTVRRCDRLLLLAEGRILDSGTYDELTQRNPEFQTLVAAERLAPPAL